MIGNLAPWALLKNPRVSVAFLFLFFLNLVGLGMINRLVKRRMRLTLCNEKNWLEVTLVITLKDTKLFLVFHLEFFNHKLVGLVVFFKFLWRFLNNFLVKIILTQSRGSCRLERIV